MRHFRNQSWRRLPLPLPSRAWRTRANSVDQCARLLVAALGFPGLPRPSYDRALWALRTWLDSWSGVGHVAVGMARQGFDLQLTRYDEKGWRATFCTMGLEHSPTGATGTASEKTPWRAVQGAAQDAVRRAGGDGYAAGNPAAEQSHSVKSTGRRNDDGRGGD
jgi:hypothetical protein